MADLLSGSELAGYRIEGLIGRGGMGVVYRATQLGLDRTVALKVIAPEVADDPGFRERFARESRLAASLSHPGVVPVYQAGEVDGQPFLSMRLVEGTDLAAVLEHEGRLDPGRAARLVAQVADALEAAHRRGLVHRDVKPANVLLEDDGGVERVYLTDFGLTKQLDATANLTSTGAWVGTVSYVAPEQIRGEALDGRADVYSLGCVLFEALTGTVPFPRESDVAAIYAHLSDRPPTLASGGAQAPPEMEELVRRALDKDPSRRPSAAQLARDVRSAAGEAHAGAAGRREPTTLPDADVAPVARARARRRLALAAATGGLVVFAAVLAIALGGGGGRGADGPPGPVDPAKVTGARAEPAVDVAIGPQGVTVGGGSVWVASGKGSTVTRLDARSGRILDRFSSRGEFPSDVALAGGSAWISYLRSGTVDRIDLAKREFIREEKPIRAFKALPRDEALTGGTELAVAGGRIWVIDTLRRRVARIDPRTRRLSGAPIRLRDPPTTIAAGEGVVWVLSARRDSATRLDVRTGRPLTTVRIGVRPAGAAIARGRLWIVTAGRVGKRSAVGSLHRLDPRTGRPVKRAIKLGGLPADVAVSPGSVWVTMSFADLVGRLDADGARKLYAVDADRRRPYSLPLSIAADGEGAWVSNIGSGSVQRVEPAPKPPAKAKGKAKPAPERPPTGTS